MIDSQKTARCSAIVIALLIGGLAAFSAWREVRADEPKPRVTEVTPRKPVGKPARSSDDALLDDLQNDLLDDAGDLGGMPQDKSNDAVGQEADVSDDAEPSDAAAEEGDPLVRISQQMRAVENRIAKVKAQADTEQRQRKIIEELAKLIEGAQQQAARGSSQKSQEQQKTSRRKKVQQPGGMQTGEASQPAKESTDQLSSTPATPPTPDQLKGLMKNAWGQLPVRAREQMSQNPPERFLPQYELMIERYYKRLAEQQNSK